MHLRRLFQCKTFDATAKTKKEKNIFDDESGYVEKRISYKERDATTAAASEYSPSQLFSRYLSLSRLLDMILLSLVLEIARRQEAAVSLERVISSLVCAISVQYAIVRLWGGRRSEKDKRMAEQKKTSPK